LVGGVDRRKMKLSELSVSLINHATRLRRQDGGIASTTADTDASFPPYGANKHTVIV